MFFLYFKREVFNPEPEKSKKAYPEKKLLYFSKTSSLHILGGLLIKP